MRIQLRRIVVCSLVLIMLVGLTATLARTEDLAGVPASTSGWAGPSTLLPIEYPAGMGVPDVTAGASAFGPSTLTMEGQFGGNVSALATQGNYAYAGIGMRLAVLDISDLSSPALVGNTPYLEDEIRDIAVLGGYAYVAADKGLRIVDISDPSKPAAVGYYEMWFANGVVVVGQYAYVAVTYDGLYILDVSDPSNPALVGTYDTRYGIEVAVSGNYAYVAAGLNGLRIINISDPFHPYETGHFIPFSPYIYAVDDVVIRDNHAYITDGSFYIVDISDPAHPFLTGKRDLYCVHGIEVNNSIAYAVDGCYGLRIYSVANPSWPLEIGSYAYKNSPSTISLAGNHVFLAGPSGSLRIVNVKNPYTPYLVGKFRTLSTPEATVVDGDLAYIAAGGSIGTAGLSIVDISELAEPEEVSFLEIPWASDIVASGDKVYLAASGLSIVSVADPATPFELGFYDTRGSGYGIALDGAYAYIADGSAGLSVVDIANPASPFEAGYADSPGYAYNVAVQGNYAYVADESAGLSIFDVSDPTRPTYIRSHFLPNQVFDVVVQGNYAFAAASNGPFGSDGLYVLDLSDPEQPADVGGVALVGQTFSLELNGNRVFTGGTGGVRVVDVSDPTSPEEVAYDQRWPVEGVHVSGDYIYSAGYDTGLMIHNRYCGDLSDEDGDGLPNSWEGCGYESEGARVDLPAMGADPLVQDIFVEVDYMEDLSHCFLGTCLSGHSHQPTQQMVDLVVEAFDRRGIHLHVDFGDEALLHPSAQTDTIKRWKDVPGGSGANALGERDNILSGDPIEVASWQWYSETKAVNLQPERLDAFTYAMFGHGLQETAPGLIGVVPWVRASELLVGMRDEEEPFYTASVFMHEIGHTIDLCHSGPRSLVGEETCDQLNAKLPNLFSIMNYAYTRSGIVTNSGRFLDYSDSTRLSNGLAEAALAELIGLSEPALDGYQVNWCFFSIVGQRRNLFFDANGWIDWDCDLVPDLDAVAVDLTKDGNLDDFIMPYDDWANIQLGSGCIGSGDTCFGRQLPVPVADENQSKEGSEQEFPEVDLDHDIAVEAATLVVTEPGADFTIPLTISNTGNLTSTVSFSETIGSAWIDAGNLPSQLVLPPGASATYDLPVNAPSGGIAGDEELLALQLNVEEDAASAELLRFRIVIRPYAWFSVANRSGLVPLTVDFTDISVGDVDSWSWDFGDNSTSQQQNPSHTYTAPGHYTVSLTVTGPAGSDTYARSTLVRVEPLTTFLPVVKK